MSSAGEGDQGSSGRQPNTSEPNTAAGDVYRGIARAFQELLGQHAAGLPTTDEA
jgi:hypothetical protein